MPGLPAILVGKENGDAIEPFLVVPCVLGKAPSASISRGVGLVRYGPRAAQPRQTLCRAPVRLYRARIANMITGYLNLLPL